MHPAIEIDSLSYSYPDGRAVLQAIDLRIDKSERVAIIGPNGAGKSTLLQHLNGLLLGAESKEKSTVRIFGDVVTRANLPKIRRDVGFVFQDPNDQLFCPTVFEDVAFGPSQFGLRGQELREKVASSLRAVGLDPEAFELRLTHHLSGGEKRRVCLAGVLACNPRVLVLDEPTAELDPRGRRELKLLLRSLPITQVIATHDLEMVVELCDRAILLDGGRVIAQGLVKELLSDEPLMLAHGLEKPHILDHRHPH